MTTTPDPRTVPGARLVTAGDLNVLRSQYRNLREAAGLLSVLGKDELARDLYKEAGDLVAAKLAVSLGCLTCRRPTWVTVSAAETTYPQAVVCGPCNARATAATAPGRKLTATDLCPIVVTA